MQSVFDPSVIIREKGRDLMQPYENTPKRQTMHRSKYTKMLKIRSVAQRLRTDLGRSVGATTVLQPVWLI